MLIEQMLGGGGQPFFTLVFFHLLSDSKPRGLWLWGGRFVRSLRLLRGGLNTKSSELNISSARL